ncbi:MAG: RtcB family protein, partial [Oscillospiraceae bacterium]|nr:RtcB family protein [Oscillospiraceae bacterium]
IAKLRSGKVVPVPKHLAYVSGELFKDYIHDMRIVQRFAELNRKAMMDEILKGMGLKAEEQFTTIHNYIDTENMILRKGSVSAQSGEKLIIPINMRDGSLICIGRGNPDWNCSAPHGAGRLMSRSAARESFTVSEFKKQMKGIYSTSVCSGTLDECPMAYKGMEDIVNNIGDTAEIISVIKPVYNFKAKDEDS